MFLFCKQTCSGRDRSSDTVRVSLSDAAAQEALRAEEDLRDERDASETVENEEPEQEEQLRAAEEIARRQAEEERLRAEAEALAQQEAADLAARQQREREEEEQTLRQERRAQVDAFLKAERFAGVGSARKRMLKTTYPLHRAAEMGNGKMVEYLLAEGADPTQVDSSGRTAAQVAERKNKRGSHGGALTAFGGA